jgi:hypothetical protein
MPQACETVAIHNPKNPSECWQINRADFDPARHVRWGEWPEPERPVSARPSSPSAPPAPPAPAATPKRKR